MLFYCKRHSFTSVCVGMAIGYVWAMVTDSLEWNDKKECTKRIFDRSSIGVSFLFFRVSLLSFSFAAQPNWADWWQDLIHLATSSVSDLLPRAPVPFHEL